MLPKRYKQQTNVPVTKKYCGRYTLVSTCSLITLGSTVPSQVPPDRPQSAFVWFVTGGQYGFVFGGFAARAYHMAAVDEQVD